MRSTRRQHLCLVAADGRQIETADLPPEPLFLNSYVARRSVQDNAFSIARPLFGKVWAEWASNLASDVVHRWPDADGGRQKRGWVAGILWALAVRRGMNSDPALWLEVRSDITSLTGVSAVTAQRRYRQLCSAGLDRPLREAPWFD